MAISSKVITNDGINVLLMLQKLLDICDAAKLTDCLVTLIGMRHSSREW